MMGERPAKTARAGVPAPFLIVFALWALAIGTGLLGVATLFGAGWALIFASLASALSAVILARGLISNG